jgi:hypothetical protein
MTLNEAGRAQRYARGARRGRGGHAAGPRFSASVFDTGDLL